MTRCLIIEGSAIIRKIARTILEKNGWAVEEAEAGEQGLAAALRRVPDVVLFDWQMRPMTAQEFVRAIRLLPAGDQPVLVYCSTVNNPLDFSRMRRLGVDGIMMKPFDQRDLLAAVNSTRAVKRGALAKHSVFLQPA